MAAKQLQQNNPASNSDSKDGKKSSGGVKKRIRSRQLSGNTAGGGNGPGSVAGASGMLSRNSSSTSLSSVNINPPSNSLDYALLLNDASRNSFDSTQSSFLVIFFSFSFFQFKFLLSK